MTGKVFVDTNVLVYRYDSGHVAKRNVSTEWLARLWREQSGRTSMQVLNELYVTLTRKLARRLSADETWDVVHALLAWDPHPVDRELLLRAREVERRHRISWWDSLVVAAAQLQGCDVLLSEDLQHGAVFDGVTVHDPFGPGVQEPRPAYADRLPSRHRLRGRPRKRPVLQARADAAS
jgi:predicted nucleic acid-binding protein